MCAHRRYGPRIESQEMYEGGMSEFNSDAIDKVKLKREPDDSRLVCSVG